MLNLKRYGVKISKSQDIDELYMIRYYDAVDAVDAKKRAMRHFGLKYIVSEVWLYSDRPQSSSP